MTRIRKLICWWKGHTFKPADGVYPTMLHALHLAGCVRCGTTFADLYDKGLMR